MRRARAVALATGVLLLAAAPGASAFGTKSWIGTSAKQAWVAVDGGAVATASLQCSPGDLALAASSSVDAVDPGGLASDVLVTASAPVGTDGWSFAVTSLAPPGVRAQVKLFLVCVTGRTGAGDALALRACLPGDLVLPSGACLAQYTTPLAGRKRRLIFTTASLGASAPIAPGTTTERAAICPSGYGAVAPRGGPLAAPLSVSGAEPRDDRIAYRVRNAGLAPASVPAGALGVLCLRKQTAKDRAA